MVRKSILCENSYPEYARPNNGVTWKKNGLTFDNRWVIPYDPYMLKKYKAHINGSHRATLEVQNQYDEIAMTVQGRYISPVQAVWRLLGYATHEEKPAVILLPYHLEGQHRVSFDPGLDEVQLIAAIQSQTSIFLDWIKYNSQHTDGRHLLYSNFPLFYTHVKNRGWHPRKKGQTICRMPVAVPRQCEHYYLRTLLTVKTGAKSYWDLYTVDSIVYNSPSAACRALGLIFDDSDWIFLFNEVKDTPAASLRQTFASALAYSTVINPQAIWDQFRVNFTDDCLWRLQNLDGNVETTPSDWSEDECRYDYGLWLLEKNLKDLNLNWVDVRMSGPTHSWSRQEQNNLIADAMRFDQYEQRVLFDQSILSFSSGQNSAFNTITNVIDNGLRPNTFFLQGPAGTGKTFLYKVLCNYYRSKGDNVLCVTSSGIASLLLLGGSTAHSQFRIPIDCPDGTRCSINRQSPLAGLLKKTRLIIWDEVTMQLKHNFGAVDLTL
ncbi:hypothetical protein EPUL_002232 [Erysiphe pulchra]|uniref:ATP-dependent DNA helicase n=1 Tax=Erysiphe pulchra TaxID=225359 RepID=A0A2S4PRL5_9PEZI|nr:hypothetical protein EPUL_002232 [Erysiphe pulchra]